MTDDLKPHSRIPALLGTAITVAAAVWGATTWLQGRADKSSVEKLANDSFQQRLDAEIYKGEMKAFNIRLERIEKGMDTLIQKSEANERRRR